MVVHKNAPGFPIIFANAFWDLVEFEKIKLYVAAEFYIYLEIIKCTF